MMKTITKLLTLIVLGLLTTGAMAQIYVDVSKTGGANNGTSWANAYTDLQSALDDPNLTTVGQIWVAKGIYKPTKTLGGAVESPVSRDATFVLPEGIKIYGGFTGTGAEVSINDRVDISTTNETVLSGDFNDDDVVTINGNGVVSGITGNAENAHHVVVSYNNTATTVLDGFTIKGGNADGTSSITPQTNYTFERDRGAGLFTRRSSPTLNNLVVKNNYASATTSAGAGLYLGGGKQNVSPQSADDVNITNAVITNNLTVGYGAGTLIAGYSGYTFAVLLKQVTFSGNKAARAGAVYVGTYTNPTFEEALFSKNVCDNDGGAVYLLSTNKTSTVTIKQSNFTENEGTRGGAIHGNTDATFDIQNTSFTNNKGTTGGAIHGNLRSTFTIEGGIFEENTGTTGGAIYGVSNASGDPAAFTIKGVSFIKNTTSGDNDGGGAIYGSTASSFNISGSTFRENTTAGTGNRYGGAMYLTTATSGFVINNSRFIGNTASAAGAIYTVSANTVPRTINNTIFYSNSTRGNGNGGAVTIATNSVVTITNSTFYSNTASGTGAGGALRYISGTLNVHNSIILGNTAGSDPDVSGTATITHSLTQGATGTNVVTNATAADVFINTTDVNHADFLKLKPITGNPAIDAGDNNLVPKIFSNDDPPVDITLTAATDLAGALRFNGTVDLGAYENHTVLPIKLLDLSAKANNNSIIVSWATETEINNSYFILEKSTDGVNFTEIANVPSKGNGAKYNYTDFSPANGNNYYKLTQVDNDGTSVSYKPIVVNFSLKAHEVSVYPNPVIGAKVTVSLTGHKFTDLQLVNLYGQKLQSLSIAPNEAEKTIDVSPYASGTYFILLTNGTERVVKKIVKP